MFILDIEVDYLVSIIDSFTVAGVFHLLSIFK
jgi:hypothetical protein